MIDLLELDDVKFCNYVRMPPEEFNTLITKFSILRPFVYENLLRHTYVINISSLIGCDATTSPQQIE